MKIPEGLSPRSAKLWRAAVRGGIEEPGRQVVLEIALRALDRAEAARAMLERDGFVVASPGAKMQHAHAGLRIEADSLKLFLELWEHLDLDSEHGFDWQLRSALRR